MPPYVRTGLLTGVSVVAGQATEWMWRVVSETYPSDGCGADEGYTWSSWADVMEFLAIVGAVAAIGALVGGVLAGRTKPARPSAVVILALMYSVLFSWVSSSDLALPIPDTARWVANWVLILIVPIVVGFVATKATTRTAADV